MNEQPGELITQAEAAERRMAEEENAPSAMVPVEATGSAAVMQMAQQMVRSGKADPGMLREFIAIAREWEREEARKSYIDALARAQGKMPVVEKNVHVEFETAKGDVDYWHADYGQLVETIAPYLSAEGLSYDHEIEQDGDKITVRCILSHAAGHTKSVVLSGSPDNSGGKNAIQAIRSTVKYLQKATFEAVSGAATKGDDDDGHSFDAQAVELITDEQREHIETELDTLGAEREGFLAYVSKHAKRRITDVADIPASAHGAAMYALEAKRKHNTEAVSAAVEAEQEALDV